MAVSTTPYVLNLVRELLKDIARRTVGNEDIGGQEPGTLSIIFLQLAQIGSYGSFQFVADRHPANHPLVRKTNFVNQNQFRGGATKASEKAQDEELKDFGGSVAGLFGNLRIPASLIAGASLGSAFALPMLDTDAVRIGMAKRLYAFSMVTTLGSMLLVVIITTKVMNDIALRPKRLSKTCAEYIEDNYGCEWMIVRSHFFYGSFAFLGACAFRAYISVACPVIGRGTLGILASLSMMCMSYLTEGCQNLGAQKLHERFGRFLKTIGNRAKTNVWFGAGAITWIWAVAYLIYKLPHMYIYLVNM